MQKIGQIESFDLLWLAFYFGDMNQNIMDWIDRMIYFIFSHLDCINWLPICKDFCATMVAFYEINNEKHFFYLGLNVFISVTTALTYVFIHESGKHESHIFN